MSVVMLGRPPVPSHRGPAPAILVGECPSPRWDGTARTLLCGSAFWRLAARVMWPQFPGDVPRIRYLRSFDRCNVVPRHVPASRWNLRVRQEAAHRARLICEVAGRRPIILLGRRAADAFGHAGDFGTAYWTRMSPLQEHALPVLLLPHPSGRCRLWNDDRFVARMRRAFRDFWKQVEEGRFRAAQDLQDLCP